MLLRIVLVCAALAIAAGTAVALLNDDGDGQEVAAAPPEDKPTPQVTVPSQTTPEPEPESPIQRVEIKGRFRKACGDNGLCLEIHKPHDRPRLPPPINGQIVGEVSISYDGEQLMGYDLMSCDVNSDNDAYYPQVGGNTRASDGILRFFGTIPIDTTDLLEIDGMFNIEQLEVDIDSLGLRHLFYGESTTIMPEDTITMFGAQRSVAEIEALTGKPFNDAICDYGEGS